jgi:hypothetical protein
VNGFLEKLERAAERWIHIVDAQTHDATVRTITGEVFVHDVSANGIVSQAEVVPQDAGIISLAPLTNHESHKTQTSPYPRVLKKVSASYK